MEFLNLISKLDLSRIHYIPQFNEDQKYFKTIIGGLISLVIYSLSFFYLIYILVIWRNGQILPKIFTKTDILNFGNFTFEESLIQISFFEIERELNLSQLQENYLIPLATIVDTNSRNPNYQLEFQNINESKVKFNNLNFIKNVGSQEKYNLIALVKCNETLLPTGGYCTNEQNLQKYKSLSIYVKVTILLKQFNQNLQDFETIPKEVIFILDESQTTYTQISLKVTEINIDDGFLFSTSKKKIGITSANIIAQNANLDKFKNAFGESYFIFLINLDPLKEEMIVSYPKFGEILAQVGSIFSLLMTLSYLQIWLNQNLFDQLCQKKILEIYFPEMKSFTIKKNILGQIQSVRRGKNEFDIQAYKEFQRQQINRLKEQFNIFNQFYELSHIKSLLFSLVPKSLILKSRKVGLKMDIAKRIEYLKGNVEKIYPDTEKNNDQFENPKQELENMDSKSINSSPQVNCIIIYEQKRFIRGVMRVQYFSQVTLIYLTQIINKIRNQ